MKYYGGRRAFIFGVTVSSSRWRRPRETSRGRTPASPRSAARGRPPRRRRGRHGNRWQARASRRRALSDVQHVQASGRGRRAQARRRRRRTARRKIAYGPNDLLDYAPIAKAHVADGGMTLADACAAATDWSDNTAANLILDVIGGPDGLTQFVRSLGDSQDPARQERAGSERSDTGRRARHHDPARDGSGHEPSAAGRTCSPKRPDVSSRAGSLTTRSAISGCARDFRRHGASATRPAAAITARRTRSRSSGRPAAPPPRRRLLRRVRRTDGCPQRGP